MIKWGIKTHLRVITFVPLALISICFSSWFYYLRHIDLANTLQERGTNFIRQLIPASEYGLISNNQQILQALANASVANSEIKAVTFYNRERTAVAYQGPQRFLQKQLKNHPKNNDQIQIQQLENYTFNYIAPVIIPEFNDYNPTSQSSQESSPAIAGINNRIIGWISIDFDGTQTQMKEYEALIIALLISLLGMIIAAIISNAASNHMVNPIIRLSRAISKALSGDYSNDLIEMRTEEVKAISNGLSQLINKLRLAEDDYQSQLIQDTGDLRHNIEALEMKNIELDLSRKEALEKNRIKSEFIANMSHEIRTPMNGVIGFTNLLLETQLTPPQKEYLSTIKKSANNLLEIINDILDFSKIEAGKLQLDNIPMDIRECVDDVLTMLAPSAHSKSIELSPVVYSDVPIKVIGDPLRLKQIITNLVGNAIKFTDQGSVTVTVSRQSLNNERVTLRIEVTDTGIGLSEEDQNHLFNAFRQADPSTARKYGGTGLGLVICEKLVQQMGGKVGIESQPGAGATFWFSFVTDQMSSISGNVIEYKSLSNIKVLTYEEHPQTRVGLNEMLKLWRMQVNDVQSTEKLFATLKYSNTQFDLIMLGLSEFEQHKNRLEDLVIEVRQLAPRIPLLSFINTTKPEFSYNLLSVGASLCLSKPLNHKKLYHALGDLLFLKKSPPTMIFNSRHITAHGHQIKLLIVEDNSINLLLFTSLIEGMNAKVITASDGIEGVRIAEQDKFDLIILDLQLPNMNGITATERIRNFSKYNKTTPIVIISAFITVAEQAKLERAGVNETLLKPINRDQLHQVIYRWMNPSETTIDASPNNSSSKDNTAETNQEVETGSVYPIDWQQCIKVAANNEDIAQDILDKNIEDLPEQKQLIIEAYTKRDLNDLHQIIHKLHGGCCYSGLPTLKQLAQEVEHDLKENKTSRLNMQIEALTTAIEQIIDYYKLQRYFDRSRSLRKSEYTEKQK